MHDKKYFKTRLLLAFAGNIIIGLCVGLPDLDYQTKGGRDRWQCKQ